jgi:hypothetical protein
MSERDGEAALVGAVGDVADRPVLRTTQREQGALRAGRPAAADRSGGDLGDQVPVPGAVTQDQHHVRAGLGLGTGRRHGAARAERAQFGIDAVAGDRIERGAERLGEPIGCPQARDIRVQAGQHRHACGGQQVGGGRHRRVHIRRAPLHPGCHDSSPSFLRASPRYPRNGRRGERRPCPRDVGEDALGGASMSRACDRRWADARTGSAKERGGFASLKPSPQVPSRFRPRISGPSRTIPTLCA